MDFLLTAQWFVLALFGIGFLIFIHELGHFIAAKLCGIRVETFALGFQPTVFGFRMRFFSFRKGETEYVIGMLPFGGYVKMAGEELTDEKTGRSDEFASKKPWQRAIVLVAGATMNILLAIIFFVIAFAIGVPFQAPRVGSTEAGSPAWWAGVLPGDRIVSVDGREATDFSEARVILALGGVRPVPIELERDGRRISLDITPVASPVAGIPLTGIAPAATNRIEEFTKTSPEQEAGLRIGDQVLGITLTSGETVLDLGAGLRPENLDDGYWDFVVFAESGSANFRVQRDAEILNIAMTLTPPDKNASLGAGLTQESRTVACVRPSSAASGVFKAGWEIIEVADQSIYSMNAWSLAQAARGAEEVAFRTSGGERGTVRFTDLVAWILQGDLVLTAGDTRIATIEPDSPAARAGLLAGDVVLSCDGQPVRGGATSMLGDIGPLLTRDDRPLSLACARGGSVIEALIPAGQRPGLSIAIQPPRVGQVFAGARVAGILPGDLIRSIGGDKIPSWNDFVAKIAAHKDKKAPVKLEVAREDSEEPLFFEVQLSPRRQAGFFFEAATVVIQKPWAEAIALGGHVSVTWSKRVLLTLRALVRREVAVRNLSGPVGIINMTKRVIMHGWGQALFFLALISLNLGVFNLLPFPILDGGHLLFLAIEKIKGSPVNEKVQYYIHLVAFMLLIALALFVTYHDIQRWQW